MDKLPVDRTHAEHWMLGTDEITVLATGDQTGGDIFAVEIRMPPGGGPPVMHRHQPSEVYHVTGGEFAFYIGESDGSVRRVAAGIGDVVALPLASPNTPPSMADVLEVAQRNGVELLGPVPALA
jgi:hypothetical protein